MVLVAHGGLIAALTARLLGLPVESWPVLGGLGNASWVQLSGHSADDAALERHPLAAGRVECLGPGRWRCPLSQALRPTLLIFADSLAYYGPTGGLPADDPRIWPNLVAAQLGWDVELIGRIGWTCRDVWWAATQDPRAWAALPRAGAVIFATSGMDSLPSPLPTALRELDPVCAPAVAASLGARRVLLAAAEAVTDRALGAATTSVGRIPGDDPWRCGFQPPGYPDRRVTAVGAHRGHLRPRPSRRANRTVAAITEWAEQHDIPLVDLKAAVAEHVMGGRGNPDGIHWNFEAHQAVADLMLKALAEAGVRWPSSS